MLIKRLENDKNGSGFFQSFISYVDNIFEFSTDLNNWTGN